MINLSKDPLHQVHYDYSYPGGLDWDPKNDTHKRILSMLLERARDGSAVVRQKHDTWREIDRVLTAYVDLDSEEKALKRRDKRKATSIVIPVSMAVLDTLTTYMAAAYLDYPIFRYEPMGPEDVAGAALLELHVNLQMIKTKAAINLGTVFRDSFVYGFGAATPIWTVNKGTVLREDPVPMGGSKYVKGTSFEGHTIHNIDPYSVIPDPHVPLNELQRGEFFGWVRRENRMEMLTKEKNSSGRIFNVRYLKHIEGMSTFRMETSSNNTDYYGFEQRSGMATTNPVDIVYLYVNLVPSEWELGSSDYPEKWLFAVAGDRVIVQASKMKFHHNMFPVAVSCPDTDGRTVCPTSRLELIYGMQHTIDFLTNARIKNLRKCINGAYIVDPKRANMNDCRNLEEGAFIRTREAAWGTGVKDIIEPLAVPDVTSNHMNDISALIDIIQRVTGATDILQGIQRKTSERITATETRGVQHSAASRLAQLARKIGVQFHQDMGYLVAAQTQQLASEDVTARVLGRHVDNLRSTYGDHEYLTIDPLSLAVDFDVIPPDGTIPGNEDSQAWVTIFQTIMAQPEMAQMVGLDIPRVFRHVAKQLGAKNVEEFIIQQDDQTQAQAQAGNIVPVQEYADAGMPMQP